MKHTFYIILLFMSVAGYSQFSGNNHMEFQIGNVPHTDPRWLVSNYNQLNLQFLVL